MKITHILAGAFIVSLGIIFFGEAGLLSAYKTSQENAKMESRIRRLEHENEVFSKQISDFQKNQQQQEHTIRASLSLVASDEILYDFQ